MKIIFKYQFADEIIIFGKDFWNAAEFYTIEELVAFQLTLIEHNEKLGNWESHPSRYHAARIEIYHGEKQILSFGGGEIYTVSCDAYRMNNPNHLEDWLYRRYKNVYKDAGAFNE